MNRILIVCALLLSCSVAASAQDASKVEAFGGYSYLRIMTDGTSINGNGGVGSVSYNFIPKVGVVGEFGGYHLTANGDTGTALTYLFGPKVHANVGRLTPFAQVLFGGARLMADGESENAFAMSFGGGADYNLTHHVGIRLGQIEYVLTKFNDFGNSHQNSFRYSAGVTVRF
jgi:opacity protein-like surface antigen